VLTPAQSDTAIAACWEIGKVADVGKLIDYCIPN
jgi:hypothetical protein